MRVVTIVLATLILCTSIVYNARALEKADIVRELVITTPNSTTVPLGEHLYTVSQNRTHVHVNSTSPTYRLCTIAIDPFEDIIIGKMKVETAHDREIFIMGVQSQEVNDGKTNTFYTLLSIDLWACIYKAIPIGESDDAEPPKKFLPTLVRYNNLRFGDQGFDIFFPSLKSCAPCHFTIEGEKKSFVLASLSADVNANEDPFHLRWMNPDYFYVYNLGNGRSVLQYLGDSMLNPTKKKYVDYPVDTIAVKKGRFRNVGVCSKKRNNRFVNTIRSDEIRCERLNSKMQSVVTISIPVSNKTVSSVTLHFDEQGNAYVSFAENNELRVYVYDVVGQLLHSYNLGEVDERFERVHVNSESVNSTSQYLHWDTRGFLVGKQYCVVVERIKADGYEGALHVVKCIRVESNTKPPRF